VEGFPGKFDRYFRNERRSLVCQEVTELVHPGGVVQEQAEGREWVDLAGEEWAAREPVQALRENACALNVELLYLMKPESLVPTRSVQNAAQK